MKRNMRRREGSILLLGMILMAIFLLSMASVFSTSLNLGKSVQYDLDYTAALSIAEGVTESAQKRLLEQISNFEEPELSGSITLSGQAYAYEATAIGEPYLATDADGVSSTVQHYVVSSTVTRGSSTLTVDRVIDLTTTPVFQYMIFYDDDLELLPGPNMTLGGRVHCNSDIYVGCGGTLTVDSDYFRATGSIRRKRKNDGSESTGTVNIRVYEETVFQPMTNAGDAESPTWATDALDTWKGTVQDGAHGVKEVAVPDIKTIKAFQPDGTKGYYHENAGLVVVDGQLFDGDGNALAIPGVLTQKTFMDQREGKNVTVTEIDVAALNASGQFPSNGLIYGYRTDASAAQPNGFRLTNASELAAPVTFVTEDPVYIKGDFNTVNKKGAAVLADAVNLLSSSFSDTGGPMQVATPTTYNLAFVTGNVPTPDGGGTYSGGFENLPRFHENWSGKTATILGSFINLFESEIAKAPWGSPNVYSAPVRNWNFDPALNDPANLPPFTPNAVHFQRVLWDDRLALPFQTP